MNDTDFVKSERRAVNVVPTIAFTSSNIGIVYVATVGEPNVVRVESPDSSTVDYSQYGEAIAIEAPPAARSSTSRP